ncbi:MAG: hypothetical protein Q8R92_06265, partial [Deltaproteobacteria bacterium]|nr:hypothetical protein [Deltaproteobacteria bacterium]
VPVRVLLTERSSLFPDLMREVRGWLGGKKVAEQLATIVGCDVRSAARYLAGDRIPSGDVVFAMMLDPVIGPRVMAYIFERARRELSARDFDNFKNEMAKATLRAFVRDNNDV